MRTVNITDVNVIREAYVAPQIEVIEMEVSNDIMIGSGTPGADDIGDPDIGGGAAQAPRGNFWQD